MKDYKFVVDRYRYGKCLEKEKKELKIYFNDRKFAIVESFFQSEINFSNCEESPFVKGLRSVVLCETDYFELTGNAYTLVAKPSTTIIIDEMDQSDEAICEIDTNKLYKAVLDWEKEVNHFYKNEKRIERIDEKVDETITKYMSNNYHMTEKCIKDNLIKLNRHEDIKNELCLTLIKGYILGEKALCVEGYTAEKLENETYLTTLGAYNYLVFLRENPSEAKKLLMEGLPRK